MNQNISYIAFFDVDLTLISINSGKILMKGAFNNGLISKKIFLKAILLSVLYKFKFISPLRIIKVMISWLEGVSEDLLEKLSEEVFRTTLINSIRPEIIDEIKFHKKNNARIVILSSSLKTVCLKLMRHLNLDDAICTELEVIDGRYTGRCLGNICFGAEKVACLKSYCKTLNIPLSSIFYYGDNISDFQVLSLVGHPICINPDKELKKLAIKEQWVIHNYHS